MVVNRGDVGMAAIVLVGTVIHTVVMAAAAAVVVVMVLLTGRLEGFRVDLEIMVDMGLAVANLAAVMVTMAVIMVVTGAAVVVSRRLGTLVGLVRLAVEDMAGVGLVGMAEVVVVVGMEVMGVMAVVRVVAVVVVMNPVRVRDMVEWEDRMEAGEVMVVVVAAAAVVGIILMVGRDQDS